MLVLTRKVNDKIIISDDIEIVITDIKDGTVRIGINAPKGIPVYRGEVYEAIKQSNQSAAVTEDALTGLGEFLRVFVQKVEK